MKLPASSSIFLTTLAISSSSSCLAAPTADTSTGHSMTSSASNRHIDGASSEGQVQPRSEGYANIEARDGGLLQEVGGIIYKLPLVGGLLSKILEANNPPSAQDLASLQNAADEVNRVFGAVGGATNSTIPLPVGDVPGPVASHLPAPIAGALSDDPNGGAGGASASAATPSQTAAAADAPSSSAQPSASSSPSMPPSGPPNTPALPVNV